ncbi:CBS domain-containing protein [Fervidicoccus fontis]|uniref:CBS domain-containing protein n=3 Tax=Fervidicoccus fontis TaxID=683846 RepID=A0A2J6N2Q8_9CREN|nr:putative transcriptional regulator [Fervidicoccus fontis Kam940]MBE9391395.1 CBS domain-containing protein [Fervidicoccus fontis]PMB75624.1 MAG: IMP dehydrogenase [Fervidicoccus fontis]
MYELTQTQREVLLALIKLYEQNNRLVKSIEIAQQIGKDEGTVRNIISSLRSLGLLESKTGPSGGYMPTLKAKELIKSYGIVTYGSLRIKKNGNETNVTAYSIEIMDVLNPAGAKAILKANGNLDELKEGDIIRLGPTDYNRLLIDGEIQHIDRSTGQIAILIKRLVSIPRENVGEVATKNLVTLTSQMPLREASSLLFREKIRGAPVIENERIVGIITTTDIAKAYSEGNVKAKVEDYMRKHVVTIREDEDIMDAVRIMELHGVGRLIVVNAVGEPKGIVTRTDILKRISALGT